MSKEKEEDKLPEDYGQCPDCGWSLIPEGQTFKCPNCRWKSGQSGEVKED